jgi:hypothetical protein
MAEAGRADRAREPERAGHAGRDAAVAYDSAERRRVVAAALPALPVGGVDVGLSDGLGQGAGVGPRLVDVDVVPVQPAEQAVATSGAPATGRPPRPTKQVKQRGTSISRA